MQTAITLAPLDEYVDAQESVKKRTVKVWDRGGRGGPSRWDRWMVEHNLVPRKLSFNASATDVEVAFYTTHPTIQP